MHGFPTGGLAWQAFDRLAFRTIKHHHPPSTLHTRNYNHPFCFIIPRSFLAETTHNTPRFICSYGKERKKEECAREKRPKRAQAQVCFGTHVAKNTAQAICYDALFIGRRMRYTEKAHKLPVNTGRLFLSLAPFQHASSTGAKRGLGFFQKE